MTDRVYRIRGYENAFDAGRTGDGRQVLMGHLCPDLVAYFFSPEGALLRREVRPSRDESLSAWKQEIGFRPGVIQVQRFFDEEQYVGIEDLPDHYENQDLWEDLDERREVEQERKEWLAQGQFVFFWTEDYYMSADGDVDST